MKTAPHDIHRLAEEICQLDPIELDKLCLEWPHEPLPMQERSPEKIRYMATVILKHYSLGDALSLVWRYQT